MLSSCVATCSHDCSLFRQSFCVRSDVSELHSSSRAASSMPAARFEGAAPLLWRSRVRGAPQRLRRTTRVEEFEEWMERTEEQEEKHYWADDWDNEDVNEEFAAK